MLQEEQSMLDVIASFTLLLPQKPMHKSPTGYLLQSGSPMSLS